MVSSISFVKEKKQVDVPFKASMGMVILMRKIQPLHLKSLPLRNQLLRLRSQQLHLKNQMLHLRNQLRNQLANQTRYLNLRYLQVLLESREKSRGMNLKCLLLVIKIEFLPMSMLDLKSKLIPKNQLPRESRKEKC